MFGRAAEGDHISHDRKIAVNHTVINRTNIAVLPRARPITISIISVCTVSYHLLRPRLLHSIIIC